MRRLFRSPWFWILLAGVAGAVALFLLYPVWGRKDWAGRLLLTLLPLLLSSVGVLVVRLLSLQRALRSRAGASDELERHVGAAVMAAWQAPLRAYTAGALELLRKGGKGGKGAFKIGGNPLDGRQFYLVLGRERAGKRTLLQNSGLHFPRIHPDDADLARQAMPFPRWYFSGEGVFLLAPGRYVSDPTAQDEVKDWAGQLAREGKTKALDGVLLTVSLEELLISEAHIERLAERLRHSLALVMAQVQLDLPVYLVFTHADLLPGFAAYFESLRGLEAQQVLGATLAVSGRLPSPRARFEREFRQLWESVRARMPMRLAQATSERRKQEIFLFPNELGAAQDKLAFFVDHLFKGGLAKETALFRGFFLTGLVAREGVHAPAAPGASPSDTLLHHPLNPRQYKAPERPQAEPAALRPLFTGLIFSGVLRADRSLSRRTAHSQGRLSRRALAISSAAAVLALGIAVYATGGYLRARDTLRETAAAISAASSLYTDSPADLERDFAVLERLLHAKEDLERLDGLSNWRIPPGYLGDDPAELAGRVHRAQFERLAAQEAMQHLEASLQLGSAYFNPAERQRLYGQLRLYLVLTGQGRGKLAPAELGADLARLWQEGLMARFGAENVPRIIVDRLPDHTLAYAMRFLETGSRPWKRPNPDLVADARRALLGSPTIDGLYQTAAAAMPRERDIRLTEMGVPGDGILRGESRVPAFYTRQVHDEMALKALEEGAKEPHRKDWVLGEAAALPADMRDPGTLREALVRKYYQSYAQEWNAFMGSLRVEMPSDMGLAAGKLAAYASPSQGLPAVLRRMRAETDLQREAGAGQKLMGEKLKKKKLGRLAVGAWEGRHNPKAELEASFAYLDDLAGGPSGGGALQNYLAALQVLSESLGQMAPAADGGASALEFVQGVFAGRLPHPLADAWREARSGLQQAPDEARIWLQPLLEQPVRQAAQLAMRRAEERLESAYQDKLLSFHRQRLEGRYPFDRQSAQEAAWEDMQVFFHPGDGRLAMFVKDDLGGLATHESGRFQLQHWNGMKPSLAPGALVSLESGMALSRRLFGENSGRPRSYSVTAVLWESRNTRAVSFALGEERFTVKPGEGSVRRRIRWPPDNPYGGAEVSVEFVGGGAETKGFDGPWGMLRLLDAARAFNGRPGGFTAKWRFRVAQKYEIDVRLDGESPETVHPFTSAEFFRFDLAPNFIASGGRSAEADSGAEASAMR